MKWSDMRCNPDMRPTMWIKRLLSVFGCVIDLHKIEATDDPGCFHSHPAYAIRLILWNGYVEEKHDGKKESWWPWKIGIVSPTLTHRIDALRHKGKASWSLWFRWKKQYDLNLITPPDWTPWDCPNCGAYNLARERLPHPDTCPVCGTAI